MSMNNQHNQQVASHASYDLTGIKELKHISQDVNRSVAEVKTAMYGNRTVYPTRWPRLNKNLMGGLQPGKMYVIAGRPGVGKSAFSNQMIFDILDISKDKNVIVLYWSFEMPGYQQILRAGSKDTKMQTAELLSVEHRLSDEKFKTYEGMVQKYKQYPIFFCSIPQDMERVKKINEDVFIRYPGTTVINLIDHSRLVRGNADTELQRLNVLSKACMWMQARMTCITILLSQLNRNIEQEFRAKQQYQPLLTDLFGGDSIGQDAHVVMMLQRPNDLYGITDKYCGEDPVGLMAVHVEKNRDGLLGMIPFETDLSTFTINERTKTPHTGG
jgi:replicative DNA helicase